jgi:hypothetical protein
MPSWLHMIELAQIGDFKTGFSTHEVEVNFDKTQKIPDFKAEISFN